MPSSHISVTVEELQPPRYGSADPSLLEQGDSHSDDPNGVSQGASRGIGRLATFKLQVTTWRFMNTALLVGLGTAKTVLAFGDNPTANSFDMALGLLWALM